MPNTLKFWCVLCLVSLFLPIYGCEKKYKSLSVVSIENGQDPKKIKGLDIKGGSFWISYIVVGGDVGQTCTGFALTPQKVVTAAHCLWSRSTKRFAQERDIGLVFSVGTAKIPYRVRNFSVHPFYIPGEIQIETGTFDIAVLTIEGSLDPRILSVKPTLVTETELVKRLMSNKKFMFMGYGLSGLLLMGSDIAIPNHLCVSALGKKFKPLCSEKAVYMFCAAPDQSDPKITGGDSGGPAFWIEEGVPKVYGITIAYSSEFSFFETFDRRDTRQWLLALIR